MTSIILHLGLGTPRQLIEVMFFFNSRKQASSLSICRHGLVSFLRSVRGADEYVKLWI